MKNSEIEIDGVSERLAFIVQVRMPNEDRWETEAAFNRQGVAQYYGEEWHKQAQANFCHRVCRQVYGNRFVIVRAWG